MHCIGRGLAQSSAAQRLGGIIRRPRFWNLGLTRPGYNMAPPRIQSSPRQPRPSGLEVVICDPT